MSATETVRLLGRGMLAGVAVAGASIVGVVAVEIVAARMRRYARGEIGPGMRATFGESGRPLVRMVMLGDSTAAGVGVHTVDESVGGQLGVLLAATGRRVELSSVAVSGSRSTDLGTQVSRALVGHRPDVAVILVGAIDATHAGRPADAAHHLAEAVHRLDEAGVAVVVGTCPDLGAARAIGYPLRGIVGWFGQRIADAQKAAVREAGGILVDLAERTGAVFRADAGTYCHDGFHPSTDGYRIWAHALYPAVYEAARSVPSR